MSGNQSDLNSYTAAVELDNITDLEDAGLLTRQEEGLIKDYLSLTFTEGEFNRYFNINNALSLLSTSTFSALVFRNIVTGLELNSVSKEMRYAFAAVIAGIMVSPGQFILTHQFIQKMFRRLGADSATFKESSGSRGLKYAATTGAAVATSFGTFHLESRTRFFSNPVTSWLPTDSLTAEVLVAIAFGTINGAFRAIFFNGKKKYTPGNEIQNECLRKLGQGFAFLLTALYGYTNAINYVASYVLMVEEIEDEADRNIAMNILIGSFCSIVLGEIPKNIEVLWNTFRLYKSESEIESQSNSCLDILYGLLRGGLGLLSAFSKTASSTLSFCLLALQSFPESKMDFVFWGLLLLVVLPPTGGYNMATAGMHKQVETILPERVALQEPSVNEAIEDLGSREVSGPIEGAENEHSSCRWRFWERSSLAGIESVTNGYEEIADKEEDVPNSCRLC
ncbi:MAG: hypothetical protein K0R48_1484 [Gammaproteobacteria bacterium]|jgi:hypothetical protein|nr:hypothetical protein [Gammaproteobacteria bacterium]